ncbi:MAG TPA: hypothetical protein VLV87_10075 [Gammaproteobacteria bacterium]|nr:hypothetical protein [Gammaproteobacteria bacterium]
MERKRALNYGLMSLTLALLSTALVLRLRYPGHWHRGPVPSFSIFFIAVYAAIKCGSELTEPGLDPERRLLIISGAVPVSLFLISLFVPASLSPWLMLSAALTLLVTGGAAFLVGRKLGTS